MQPQALQPAPVVPVDCPGLTVMIDNFDSFTYNIVQYLQELGADVRVFRNDAVTLAELEALAPARIVLSPGPGAPCDAGVTSDVLRAWAGRVPILGVCLGLQCMYEAFGGTVTHAGEIMHGKASAIEHDGRGVFAGLPSPFQAVRYHSLAGTPATLPRDLRVTARTANGIIQGVRHAVYALEGVQFHPESILTQHGHAMFRNFLQWRGGLWPAGSAEAAAGSLGGGSAQAEGAAAAAAAAASPAAASPAAPPPAAPAPPLAILSVLPAATAIVYALGLQGALRGVSHECLFPPPARRLPRVLRAAIDSERLSSAEIDAAVKAAGASGAPLYALEAGALAAAAAGCGTLVVLTQALCDVCAAGPRVLGEALARLPPGGPPRVIVDCSAASLAGMLGDVRAVAAACGVAGVGEALVARLQARIEACVARAAAATAGGRPRPRVACVEWLSPLYNSVRCVAARAVRPAPARRVVTLFSQLLNAHTPHATPPPSTHARAGALGARAGAAGGRGGGVGRCGGVLVWRAGQRAGGVRRGRDSAHALRL